MCVLIHFRQREPEALVGLWIFSPGCLPFCDDRIRHLGWRVAVVILEDPMTDALSSNYRLCAFGKEGKQIPPNEIGERSLPSPKASLPTGTICQRPTASISSSSAAALAYSSIVPPVSLCRGSFFMVRGGPCFLSLNQRFPSTDQLMHRYRTGLFLQHLQERHGKCGKILRFLCKKIYGEFMGFGPLPHKI